MEAAASRSAPRSCRCSACGIEVAREALVSRATEGRLTGVCQLCFHALEIQALAPHCPQVRQTVADGLETLYQLLRSAVEERVSEVVVVD